MTSTADQISERRVLLDEITADIEIAERLKTGVDLATLRRTARQLEREIRELSDLAGAFCVRHVERLESGRYRVTIADGWTFADGTQTADVDDADDYKHTWIEPRSYTGRQSRTTR